MSKSVSARTPKVQRWIDLIAALLRYHYAVEFATIADEVPAYRRAQRPATIKRMFERDKDELRALGIPIESVANDEGGYDRYRLRARDFYLPYLTLVDEERIRRVPSRPRGYGYQALTALELSADELAYIVRAAQRVQQLGDASLARDGAAALRKLAHDIPQTCDSGERVLAAPHPTESLDLLDDAVRRRKLTAFDYHGFGRNASSHRQVRPYGLVFLSGVWYLVAQDADAPMDAPVKQFRVQRMRNVTVAVGRPQQPDFDLPAHIDLRHYASLRHPWELGTDAAIEAIVAFPNPRGATHDAIAMGHPVAEGSAHGGIHRRYTVRRIDAFARFLLAQGGDAVPVSPMPIVEAYRDLIERTVAAYTDTDP
jgi:proteasome accessory factor B